MMRGTSACRTHPLIPGGAAMTGITYGLARYAYGLFVPHIQAAFALTDPFIGLVASGSYLAYLMATSVSAVMTARIGFLTPTVVGGLSAAAGMATIGLSDNRWWLFGGVLVAGMSPGWWYPAMPEAVKHFVPAIRQSESLTWINTGTAYGVIIAGPAAWWLGHAWRLAWLVFALLALAVTLAMGRILRQAQGPPRTVVTHRLRLPWLVRSDTVPLLVIAFALGVATSIYWTFAVEFLTTVGHQGVAYGTIFWIVVGVAGILGGWAGRLISRCGLSFTYRISVIGIALALGLLATWPSNPGPTFLSALLFGGSFIMVTGLLAVSSVRVFSDRPSAGLGAVFFLISAGQVLGPFLTGVLISHVGWEPSFYIGAVLTAVLAAMSPSKRIPAVSHGHRD